MIRLEIVKNKFTDNLEYPEPKDVEMALRIINFE